MASISRFWKTRFNEIFPCEIPILGAPMRAVSGGELAAQTCRAGALGFIAAGHCTNERSVEQLEEQIQIFRSTAPANAPLCIGFIGFSSFQNQEAWRCYQHVLEKHKPSVVQFFAPVISSRDGISNIQMAHECQAKVFGQVGSVLEGQQALAAGVDGIIAQGSEGGGHGLRRELGNGTLSLAARLVQLASESPKKPVVLAAGGIADGRGVAAALALGCDGAVLGTRLWASEEALNRRSLKDQLVSAKSCDDVQRTRVFDQIINTYSATPWPAPYDTVGALRNTMSEQWDGRATELDTELSKKDSALASEYRLATQQGDTTIAQVLAGEGVGEIDNIEPAYNIIVRVEKEARDVIRNLSTLL